MARDQVVKPAGAKTTTYNTPDFDIPEGSQGGIFILDVTAASGTTPTLDVKIQTKDPLSGKYVDIPSASFARKTGVTTDSLAIYPGTTGVANRVVNGIIGKTARAVATIGGTTPSFDFTVSFTAV